MKTLALLFVAAVFAQGAAAARTPTSLEGLLITQSATTLAVPVIPTAAVAAGESRAGSKSAPDFCDYAAP